MKTLLAVLIVAVAAMAQTTINGNNGLSVTNGHTAAIVAFHLENAAGEGINQVDRIPAGEGHAYQASGQYRIDGILYEDGSIQGPNRWRVDLHYKLWQQIEGGGPAYPSAVNYAERGDSVFYARIWARRYKRAHGVAPTVIWPDAAPQTAPISTINPMTANAQAWQDGLLACAERGPSADCEAGEVFDGTTGFTTATVTATITGLCTKPLTIPGKSSASAGSLAFTQCPMATVFSEGYLNTDVPYPYSGYLTAAYADGSVQFVGGIYYTGYQINSCSLPAYTSPPIVQGCFN